jgi:Carboxypeptidase regulatory-like domain
MWLRRCAPVLCALLVVAQPAVASAQTLLTGAIAGEVRRETGAVLGGVTVTLTGSPGAVLGVTRTSGSGTFAFPTLEPGVYDARFEQLGYHPVQVEGIAVRPGAMAVLRIGLPAVAGQLDQVEVQRVNASGGAAVTAAQRWLLGPVAALPFGTDDLSALAVLSSRAGHDRRFEGLPARMNAYSVDGLPRAARSDALGRQAMAASLRNTFLSFAELSGDVIDVERPATAGGLFSAISRLGGGTTSGTVFGDWSGDALGSSDGAPAQSYRAGAEVGGTFADSARFLIQGEFAREEVPLASVFAGQDFPALTEAVDQQGGDLTPWTTARALRTERANVSASVGLPVGATNRLRAHATLLVEPSLDGVDLRTGQPIAIDGTADARELFAGGTLSSLLGGGAINEISFGFESGRLARDGAITLPLTQIVSTGAVFGSDDRSESTETVRQLYLRETIHLPFGAHRVKLGGWVAHNAYDVDPYQDRAANLAFTTAEDLVAGGGSYAQLRGTPRSASIGLLQAAVYLQDDWVPQPALRLTAGARVNILQFPDSSDIRFNEEFFEATGIDNRSLPGRTIAFEPRFAASWSPGVQGEWLVQASALVTQAAPAPDAVAEVLSNDGTLEQHVAIGDGVTWPAATEPQGSVVVGESLSLLGPEYSGARTSRLSGGIRRTFGAFSIGVEGTYRLTEFLPRRRDLNLLPLATEDQHGRPVFGALAKSGGVIAAEPGANRRFDGFAQVWALEATGTSRYTGLTLSLERSAENVGVLARYTYSRTEDDWLGGLEADPEAQLSPFPDGVDGVDDWADGVSDFDVPHRLALGAEVKVPGRYGPRIAALYRRESGAPFTPGFRAGVDVNADGSATNDPAFIDVDAEGMDALIADWSCLADDVGGFASRNGCRGDPVQSLDARLSVQITDSERFDAHLVVDALDLLSSEREILDRAVYLVDPDQPLATSDGGATTTIPLLVNPGFGEPLLRYAPQRRIRIGLRLRF